MNFPPGSPARKRRGAALPAALHDTLGQTARLGKSAMSWTAVARRSRDTAFASTSRVEILLTSATQPLSGGAVLVVGYGFRPLGQLSVKESVPPAPKRRGAALPAAVQDTNWFTQDLCVIERLAFKLQVRQIYFMPADKTAWPHAPEHRLSVRGTYFVTASTYLHAHHFAGKSRLAVLHRGLLKVAGDFGWQLEAWAVFSNHYHFVGHSPQNTDTAENLSRMLGLLHEKTAKWVNQLDAIPARKVWHNYRETRLTYEKSYLARLNYTHQNPVKHGLVPVANLYPWGSARWFERTATPAQIKTIYKFKTSQIKVPDDFEASPDW